MVSFYVTITPSGTSAQIYGRFTGGDESYDRQRKIIVNIDGYGSVEVLSTETSGGTNTFSTTITGLTANTSYSWSATLYYSYYGSWTATSYSDSGSFTTGGSGGGGGKSIINTGSFYSPTWTYGTPVINTGSFYSPTWTPATSVVNIGSFSSPNWT